MLGSWLSSDLVQARANLARANLTRANLARAIVARAIVARANLARAIVARSLNEPSLSWGWLSFWLDSARIIKVYMLFFLPNPNLIIHLSLSLIIFPS
jgi:Pentapeptide repeats (8 copies)